MKTIVNKQTSETQGMRELSDFPEYRKAVGKKAELMKQLNELNARIEAFRMTNIRLIDSESMDADARHLIQYGGFRPESAVEDIARMSREASVINRAIEIQGAEMIRLEDKFSIELCAPLKKPYADIVARLLAAATALADAAREEERFRRELDRRGIRHEGHIRPVIAARMLGERDLRSDEYRLIEQLHEAARDAGHIKSKAAA